MARRILWVTPHLPRRGVSAARERWWALLARLARRHTITLLAFVDPEDVDAPDDLLPPGLAAVHRVPRRRWEPDDPLALLPRTVAGGYSDPALRAAIADVLAGDRFDLVQYEFTEMAALMPASPVPVLLTVHQIHFAAEADVWRAQGRPSRSAPVLLHRYLRELDFELRAVAAADHVVTMSPEDAARLHRFLPRLPVSVSPVGVDLGHFAPGVVAPAAPTDAVFVGNFIHPPNADAVRFLVADVLPRIPRPVRLRVLGRGAREALGDLAGRVELLPDVPDVRPHLAAAAAVVAPVRFGTGMRGKVLEALAMGRPLVTTTLGAEGLGARGDDVLLVADDAPAFASALARVLDDAPLAARLAAGGRAHVAAHFGWDAIAAAHDAIYDAVLARPHAGARAAAPHPADGGPLRGWPGVAAGAALLGVRGVAWHLRRLAA